MPVKRIANVFDLSGWSDRAQGTRFASRHALVATTIGAVKLGYHVTEVPPGKAPFPYHFHHVNEEMFFVLEGTGEVRMPDGTHPLKRGDILCCPPGPDGAHQIVNTGSEPLRYLALSTMQDPEVVEYPDSAKYGVVVGRKAGKPPSESVFHAWAFVKDRVDYWAGEDT